MSANEQTKLRQVLNLYWSERYGYPFDDWVADRRDRGAKWRQIEREIRDMVGIELSHASLINWFSDDHEAVA